MEKEKHREDMEVDLVYLWVNGNDPEWRKKRAKYSKGNNSDSGMDCEARYENNNELKYSLRSVEKYAPWIRKIFIVTDNQIPEWLNVENNKIKIIDHKEILPPEALPTFNSNVIEHLLFRIPDLSEYFLYANDDMFFNRPVEKKDFFTYKCAPIIRLNRRYFRKIWKFFVEKILKKQTSYYNLAIQKSAQMVADKYGRYISHKPHHNIDAYKKSDYRHTFEVFKEEIEPTLQNHTRAGNDIQRVIYSFVPILEKKAVVKYVNGNTSFRCHIEKPYYFDKLVKKNPLLFCLNDSQYADSGSHVRLRDFMESRFPDKSLFEK